MARFLWVSVLILTAGLAGCLSEDAAPPPPVPESLTFREVPETVVVFNATVGPAIDFWFSMKPACNVAAPAEVLSLYDREGLVARIPYAAEPGAVDVRVTVNVTGTPPFALAGQLIPCAAAETANVTGILDGFQPRALQFDSDDNGGRIYLWVADALVTTTLATGEQEGETAWVPDEFSWGLYNIRSSEEGRSGQGVTRQIVYDASGRSQFFVGCAQLVLEPCLDQRGPFLFTPEGYRFVVESDVPTPGLSRSVMFSQHRFLPEACTLGFAWSICA